MGEKKIDLAEIAKQVATCQKCPLFKDSTKPVPGEGNPIAEVMFIGEAPGFNEDLQGRPFVGQAGKLLDQLLSSVKVAREDVFIANVVKHRPPENREPTITEIEECQEFLDKQIETIQPKIIVTLGRFSMEKFIPGAKISQIHGLARFLEINGRKTIIIPMFHPAAALRGESVMRMIKEDFLKIPQFLNSPEKIALENPAGKEENSQENKNKADNSQLSLL